MTALPFPSSSNPGAIPGEGTGRLVNTYAARDGDEVRFLPSPGLTALANPTSAAPRGGLLVGNLLYQAREDSLWTLDAANTLTRFTGLSGTRPITMARNARAASAGGPDIVVVSEVGAQIVTSSGLADYPGSVVGSPNDVCTSSAYFVFGYASGVIRASQINSTDLNDQSYTTADAKPDGLYRVTALGTQIFAWGQSTIEILDNVGTIPFPFQRANVIPVGLFGPYCVAGFEDGWDGPQIFVAADGTVRRLDGYTPTRISTRAVERSIATASGPSVLRACVYTHGGNAIWCLSGPGFTWEFNVTAGEWNERVSTGLARWRGETSIRAFGAWLIGDTVTGAIARIDPAARLEVGAVMASRIESGPLRSFPAGARVGGLTLDITTGEGDSTSADPTRSAPVCRIGWSLDGGATWKGPRQRPIGPTGAFARRVKVGDLGRAKRDGVRVSVEVTDPVAFSFRGADVAVATDRKAA